MQYWQSGLAVTSKDKHGALNFDGMRSGGYKIAFYAIGLTNVKQTSNCVQKVHQLASQPASQPASQTANRPDSQPASQSERQTVSQTH